MCLLFSGLDHFHIIGHRIHTHMLYLECFRDLNAVNDYGGECCYKVQEEASNILYDTASCIILINLFISFLKYFSDVVY